MNVVLVGKSGCGKDSILRKLVNDYNFNRIISWTSRPKRENEVDGLDYHFCNKVEFLYLIDNNKLLEYRAYNTLYKGKEDIWFYGLLKEKLKAKNNVVVLDLVGAKSFIDYYGKENCKVFYIDVDEEERTKRAMKRGSFDIKEWCRRLLTDEEDFSEDNRKGIVDFIIENKRKIDETVKEIIDKCELGGYYMDEYEAIIRLQDNFGVHGYCRPKPLLDEACITAYQALSNQKWLREKIIEIEKNPTAKRYEELFNDLYKVYVLGWKVYSDGKI